MCVTFRKDYLSKDNSNCFKAVFALMIVISHLYGKRSFLPFIGPLVTAFGYLSVAGFLFFSGYGLTYSLQNKGQAYFKGYFKKRILPIYIINAILIVAYSLFKFSVGMKPDVLQIVQSFFFGNTVVQFGWYIQAIMLFYLMYFISFRKSSLESGMVKLTLLIITYCVLCYILKKSKTWYESSFAFVFGALWAQIKPKADEFLSDLKKNIIAFFASASLFTVLFVLGSGGILPEILKTPIKMLSAVVFILTLMLFAMRVRVNYKPVNFFGKYYFEVYFMQGFFIILFNDVLKISNIALLYVLCIVCTYISAILVKPAVELINAKCRGE